MDSPTGFPHSSLLLDWYDRHARDLPWRVGPKARASGEKADPYRVWLSEIMLQQTTVQAVKAYFEVFTSRWPILADLARAPREEVMEAWAGLGYYSRARNLKACAETVMDRHDGLFPQEEEDLLALPGIGPYTAAAISAIAFDRRAVVVDGNVERVITRLYCISEPLPGAKPLIRAAADRLTPQRRSGDFAQAMMDLGATICTPRSPACSLCPLNHLCEARARGAATDFPVKAAKVARPIRYGGVFVIQRPDGAILLRRRPDKGLLGGMVELPGGEWTPEGLDRIGLTPPLTLPFPALKLDGPVEHTFTHFHLLLDVLVAETPDLPAPDGCWWSPPEQLKREALPSVMKKALKRGFAGLITR